MKKIGIYHSAALFLLMISFTLFGASAEEFPGTSLSGGLWSSAKARNAVADSVPVKEGFYNRLTLNMESLSTLLKSVPSEFAAVQRRPGDQTIITIPLPNGLFSRFAIEEASNMEPELAVLHPEIKSYRGRGIDDPAASLHCDISPLGFHAQILSEYGTIYVDPSVTAGSDQYITYDKRGLDRPPFTCGTEPDPTISALYQSRPSLLSRLTSEEGKYRTYKLALACTGEYAAAVCTHNSVPVTIDNVKAAMNTTIGRINGIYERELSVHLSMVENASIIYTNAASDPFTNNDGNSLLNENQTVCNNTIGSANYDIGHVFSTGGGGVAALASVCNQNYKAMGVTGSPAPYGDAYDVDYVAHEMGHQFGANHTFISTSNGCGGGNKNSSTAYERGSGVTIMAYAGICSPDDLEPHSYDYFHTASLNEITNHLQSTGCALSTTTGNRNPVVDVPVSYANVPLNTPFTLTPASYSDADGNPLTFCWDDWDKDAAVLFRPWALSSSPSRTFPRMSDILANTVSSWETLPSSAQTKKFLCTVRDGKGFSVDSVSVSFAGSAFVLTAPNTALSLTAGTPYTVTWDKGGSVSATVSISFSSDGGNSWSVIEASTPNDESQSVLIPFPGTGTFPSCRIKIAPTDNIYFDVSNVNFTVTASSPSAPTTLAVSEKSSSELLLNWVDNSTTETQFLIERKAGSESGFTEIGQTVSNVTSFSDKNFPFMTNCTYRVRASNGAGYSAYSNEASILSPSQILISVTPENVQVTTGMTQQFTASVTGNANTGAGWSVIDAGGGSVSGSGLYTAPAVEGVYRIEASSSADSRRKDTVSVTVVKPVITFPALPAKIYGDADFDPGVTSTASSPIVLSSDNTSAVTIVDGKIHIVGKGTAVISAVQSAVGNFAAAVTKTQSITVSARPVAVKADPASVLYGEPLPAYTYQISSGNLVNGDAFTGALSCTPGSNPGTGTYPITQGTLALSANYQLSYTGDNLTVTKRPITITAESKTITYGQSVPADYTASITSGTLAYSDAVTGKPTCSSTGAAGSYAVTLEGVAVSAPANYTVTFISGTLTINPLPLSVKADPQSCIYGDPVPALTSQITAGTLINGDLLTGSLTRAPGTSAGKYPILLGTLANSNYAIAFDDDTLTIQPKPITVKSLPAAKIYGDPDPVLSYSAAGLIGGDNLTGSLSRISGESAGKYATSVGTLANPNYTIAGFDDDTLTVTLRPVTVKADPKTVTYGTADPALTYSFTSGTKAFSDQFSGSPVRQPGTAVGKYAITRGTLDLNSSYALSWIDDSLTISPKTVTVTADSKQKNTGEADPVLTFSYAGFIDGENESVLTAVPQISRAPGESAGTYPITVTGTSAKNYTFLEIPGVFTILPITALTDGGPISMDRSAPGVIVLKNPVLPEDGFAEFAVIVKGESSIRCVIADMLGNILDEQSAASVSSGEPRRFTWDLKNRFAQPVGSGSYLIFAEVTDRSSGVTQRYRAVVGVKR